MSINATGKKPCDWNKLCAFTQLLQEAIESWDLKAAKFNFSTMAG